MAAAAGSRRSNRAIKPKSYGDQYLMNLSLPGLFNHTSKLDSPDDVPGVHSPIPRRNNLVDSQNVGGSFIERGSPNDPITVGDNFSITQFTVPETQSDLSSLTLHEDSESDSETETEKSSSLLSSSSPKHSSMQTLVRESMLLSSPSTQQKLESCTKDLCNANFRIAELREQLEQSKRELEELSLKNLQIATNCIKSSATQTAPVPVHLVQTLTATTQTSPIANPISIPTGDKKLLFRAGCRLHVLSNFANTPLTHNGIRYKTAEHAYQHAKAMHHQQYGLAVSINRCRTAALAKRESRKITGNATWEKTKVETMKEILLSKMDQSAHFRETLLQTSPRALIHNVETDDFWGCGEDGLGRNILGVLLEEIRAVEEIRAKAIDIKTHSMPTTRNAPYHLHHNVVTSASPTCTTNDPSPSRAPESSRPRQHDQKPQIMIVTDSMLRDLNEFMDLTNYKVRVDSYGGATATKIAEVLPSLLRGRKPEYVIIHCGTNSTTNENASQAKAAFDDIMKHIRWANSNSKIIISGITHRLDQTHLNSRIDSLNDYLAKKEDANTWFVEHNATFRSLRGILARDGLHLKPAGKKQVASNLMLTIKTGVNRPGLERTRWQVNQTKNSHPVDQTSQHQPPHRYRQRPHQRHPRALSDAPTRPLMEGTVQNRNPHPPTTPLVPQTLVPQTNMVPPHWPQPQNLQMPLPQTVFPPWYPPLQRCYMTSPWGMF